MSQFEALVIHSDDNVATLLVDARCGDTVRVRTNTEITNLVLKSDIRFGHKCAVSAIKQGDAIIKYGKPIGVATQDIACGEHVHIHNVQGVRAHG